VTVVAATAGAAAGAAAGAGGGAAALMLKPDPKKEAKKQKKISAAAASAQAAVIARVMVGAADAPISVVDGRLFSVASEMRDEQGAAAFVALRKRNPNVLFVIARSWNLNLVAYEGRIDQADAKRLDQKDPVDIYWLNLAPDLVRAARAAGTIHDKDSLGSLERRAAYGLSVEPEKLAPGCFRLLMNAKKDLAIRAGIDKASGRPRAYIELHPDGRHQPGEHAPGGIICFLERIYVNVIRSLLSFDVDWLVYYGTSVAGGRPVSQKLIRIPPKQATKTTRH
jgi:hypothetical protein